MSQTIDAALIGACHSFPIEEALAESGLQFRETATAGVAMFFNSFVRSEDRPPPPPQFQQHPRRIDPALHGQAKASQRVSKSRKLNRQLLKISTERMHVFCSLGMTATGFSRQAAATIALEGGDPAVYPLDSMRAMAEDYFAQYMPFYESMKHHSKSVTCFYGPTRFEPGTRDLWLAYDDVIREQLARIGIHVLDLRNRFGDHSLLLRPEYNKDEPDDGVHANVAWGRIVGQEILAHLAGLVSREKGVQVA